MTSQILVRCNFEDDAPRSDFEAYPRRSEPYIHPSWLAKYLSGDRQCLYAMYGQANYKLPKPDSDFDLEGYKLQHQEALDAYAVQLRQEGYTVHTEDVNAFKLTSRIGAVISGQPDIIAIRDDEVLVVDIKTGRKASKDIAQVKVYMAMIPAVKVHGITAVPVGRLVYNDEEFDIEPENVTTEFKARVATLIHPVGEAEPPAPVPSAGECRFCPAALVCSHKVGEVAEGEADWI
ncbi:MAG: PD-(D/E)XK nuclease family protein [Leptolyngbya sp.]|nr:PD-(D/E)XK nuclease family protein [Leptolyngbya sp.]